MTWKNKIGNLTLLSSLLLLAAGPIQAATEVSVGVYGEIEEAVWETVARALEEDDIDLDVEVFTDFVQLNNAVAEKQLDMNAVQHMAYLIEVIESTGADLAPIGYTYIQPMAAYSNLVTDLNDLEKGATIAIPNDPSNQGRALQLLEQAGLISLAENVSSPAVSDIVDNPKELIIKEIDPGFIFLSLEDVDSIIANTNVAVDNGYHPEEDGIFVDTNDLEQVNQLYKNIITVHGDNVENEIYLKIVETFQTDEVEAVLQEVSNGANQRAWAESDDITADFLELKDSAGLN